MSHLRILIEEKEVDEDGRKQIYLLGLVVAHRYDDIPRGSSAQSNHPCSYHTTSSI
jgi:hypothetical protein